MSVWARGSIVVLLCVLPLLQGCTRHSKSEHYYLITVNVDLPYWKTAGEGFSKAAAEYSLASFNWHLDMLENRLRDRQFVMGAFSLVDIPIASVLGLGNMASVPLGQRPAVRGWLDRCGQRPARARVD